MRPGSSPGCVPFLSTSLQGSPVSKKQIRKAIKRTRETISLLRITTDALVLEAGDEMLRFAPIINNLLLCVTRQVKLAHKLESKRK